ncbi:MAG: UDP-N-acetylglucosamine diphosphorylase/glucosamine-1-phosphate N-acetyltransferase [Bacteroidia bacterium]|jgi:UDP-N-acetylglucosamine diphosphorylase/glucosamine-1-phosphate N-acetyltransferase
MNIVLFDDALRDHLLPLTFTRPVAELRVGILTIAEKWSLRLNAKVSYKTEPYLQQKYSEVLAADSIYVNGACLPTIELVKAIAALNNNESLISQDDRVIAKRVSDFDTLAFRQTVADASFVNFPEDIFTLNGAEIEMDFDLVTEGRESQLISTTNQIIGTGRIFLEEGAKVEGAILNASSGSIYVGKNSEVMEGCIVRGSLALCEASVLKLGAKIYGPTTIGPHSRVGGEVNNCVILGYSNKGHDGFLGNSVLGEWCNLGADTNNSNLKNNYAEVKIWSYVDKRFRKTGTQFCGLIMGDHSKCGINTMFNTGTVVGVSSNIFGSGFPRNYVPSFAWGGAAGYSTYQLKKAFDTAGLVMERRNKDLNDVESQILEYIFNHTSADRFWEN